MGRRPVDNIDIESKNKKMKYTVHIGGHGEG